MAICLHVVLLLVFVHERAPFTLRAASSVAPGAGLRVTLVAPARPVTPVTPVKPVTASHPPRPPVYPRLAPVLTSHAPDAQRTVPPAPAHEPVPPVEPHTPAPAQPTPAAPAPTPAPPALNLPGASTAKDVAHVSCDIAQPPYPPKARRLGHEGRVDLRVTIDPAGRITQADVVGSSGFAELDDAAREAMLAGHCEPYVDNGAPITVHARQPLDFRLDN
ncbi:hypothetical protein WT25_20265 [Burkholderia territorii]|nr:hypothetical protein WT25_20265 [Burkholderia territorii]